MARIKEGIDIAQESFVLLWQHPYLVLYMALSSLLSFGATLLFAWTQLPYYFTIIPIIFIRQLCIIFLSVRLVHHTLRILHHREESIKKEFSLSLPNARIILWWTAITTVIHTIWAYVSITSPSFLFVYTIGTALLIAWVFFTLLIIPIMTTEQMRLRDMIKLSAHLAKNNWLEMLSGQAVILSGFILTWLISHAFASLIALVLIWPIESIIYTVQMIFITLIFYYFYKRPIEEIDILRYPEM